MSGNKYSVSLSLEAKEDIRSIAAHITYTLKNKISARNQTRRIRNEIRELNQFPERYGFVEWEPWHSMDVHKMPVDNFVVYYLVDKDTKSVLVIRIFYGGRDVEGIINGNDI